MNTISDQIMEGMKTAMKAKDSVTLNTLRALKTALTNTAIAKGGLGTRLEEAEELAVVRKRQGTGTQHPRLCQLPGNHGNRSRLPGGTFSCH